MKVTRLLISRYAASISLAFGQVLAILYDGHAAAEQEPRLLGTTENKVRSLLTAAH
jgi:hypothetical protein